MLLQVQEAAAAAEVLAVRVVISPVRQVAYVVKAHILIIALLSISVTQLLPVQLLPAARMRYAVEAVVVEEVQAEVVVEEVQEGAVHHRRFAATDRLNARKW